jgi:hypothetical protein
VGPNLREAKDAELQYMNMVEYEWEWIAVAAICGAVVASLFESLV